MRGVDNTPERAYGGSGDLPDLAMASVADFSGGAVPAALLARSKKLRSCISSEVNSTRVVLQRARALTAAASRPRPASAPALPEDEMTPEPHSVDWVDRTTLEMGGDFDLEGQPGANAREERSLFGRFVACLNKAACWTRL